jgi:hypothetical protein
LPSVKKRHSAKKLFASVKNKTLGKKLLRRVFSFTEVFCVALGKELLCRVTEKNTRKKYDIRQRAKFPAVLYT